MVELLLNTNEQSEPERKVYSIDVGNMTKGEAELYVKAVMLKHQKKLEEDGVPSQGVQLLNEGTDI